MCVEAQDFVSNEKVTRPFIEIMKILVFIEDHNDLLSATFSL